MATFLEDRSDQEEAALEDWSAQIGCEEGRCSQRTGRRRR